MPEVVQAEKPAVIAPQPSAPRRYEIPVLGDEKPKPETTEVAAVQPAAPAEGDSAAQDTGDQATPAKPEGDEPEKITPDQAAKRESRRFERRIDKAYRERAEALARAEILAKQLAEVQKPTPPQGEPKLEQFDFDPEKYATAKAEFAKTQAQKEFVEKQRTESGKQEYQALVSTWEEKAERGADKYDDWQQKVGTLTPNTALVAAIMEADNGEEVAYYLAKHEKEANRIAQLPPRQCVFQLGLLAAKLAATPEKPKAPSKAPAPITPLAGVAQAAQAEPSEQDDMATWVKKRNKQLAAKR